ncbi:hypothetical protein ACHAPU_009665 [Fusarium lateritium]
MSASIIDEYKSTVRLTLTRGATARSQTTQGRDEAQAANTPSEYGEWAGDTSSNEDEKRRVEATAGEIADDVVTGEGVQHGKGNNGLDSETPFDQGKDKKDFDDSSYIEHKTPRTEGEMIPDKEGRK